MRATDPSQAKLAFLIPMLGAGGAERVTIDIARGLRPHVRAIDIVTNESVGEFVENVGPDITLQSVDSYHIGKVIWRLRAFFDREKPDIVFAQGTRMSVQSALAWLLGRHRPHIIWCLHNPYSTKHDLYSPPIAAIVTRAVAWLAKIPTRIIGVSEGVCRSFVDFCGKEFSVKTSVLHNPIPPYVGIDIDRSEVVRPARLIAVGRLERQKNFALLIDAIDLVRQQEDVRLSVYGQGPLRDSLQQQIDVLGLQDIVTLEGYASDIRDRMAQSDMFVLSSSWEGLPTVLIEAMTTGIPVVSTDCRHGPFEILEGGKWGRLVAEAVPSALAQAIVDVLRSGGPDPRPRAADFAPSNVIDRYRDLIRDVLAESGKSALIDKASGSCPAC
ncbi:glycosyltransferase [Rhizorhabdus wittichii]|uniref:Glycosyltransferase n=1 Tax=Rhizorhabdus wittichii TaxID=160791 RepID=A0A975D1P0_9SPHN|nr:glycosyltransferase [Rhizorhabdus wittichii]QTH20606.1 glycosyltransferase [Rhizorhabdus wittichii]